jgi:hypothetical protein
MQLSRFRHPASSDGFAAMRSPELAEAERFHGDRLILLVVNDSSIKRPGK